MLMMGSMISVSMMAEGISSSQKPEEKHELGLSNLAVISNYISSAVHTLIQS